MTIHAAASSNGSRDTSSSSRSPERGPTHSRRLAREACHASVIADDAITDPLCGRAVDPLRARAVGIFGGQTRYFCSAACKTEYAARAAQQPSAEPPVVVKPPAIEAPRVARRAAAPVERSTPVETSEATPAPQRGGYLLPAGAVAIAAVGAVVWLGRPHAPKSVLLPPRTEAAAVAASPSAPPAVPVPPAPVAAAPASSVPAYEGSIKLGLRGFSEADGWSLRLLVIDDAGHGTIVPIGSGAGKLAVADEAVEPKEEFKRSRREPGVVFQDALQTGNGVVELEVERRATELVARSRPAGGAWSEKVVAKLGADTAVRAAQFSRARYAVSATQ